ncbi:MAG: hypothetical protein KDD77_18450 [Caldilineaceae bacterium]|nr:hypothetical protein [Caldilineaceae bacterium]
MFDTGLTAYWIDSAAPNGPLGIGVTAWSPDDAFRIARGLGYRTWLAEDREPVGLIAEARVHALDPYVRRCMGPIVVRGVWYPFSILGVPRWADVGLGTGADS